MKRCLEKKDCLKSEKNFHDDIGTKVTLKIMTSFKPGR